MSLSKTENGKVQINFQIFCIIYIMSQQKTEECKLIFKSFALYTQCHYRKQKSAN